MKVSIAVPSYNYAKFLDACLSSIQGQSYTNFEVLIADGGSNDGSLEIIHRFCKDDDRFKLVSTEDSGQSDSIFKAFQLASGDIFCFLNADDCYLCNDAFNEVVNTFNHYNDIKILSFSGYYIDAGGFWIKKINYRYHPFDGFHLMPYRTAVLQPATFWKKEVFLSNEWPKSFNYVFDVVFFYMAYQKYAWLELPKPVAGYRLHGENKSMNVKANRVFELAEFEKIKFGQRSLRAFYLNLIGYVVVVFEKFGSIGMKLSKLLYVLVNGLAYITCYRLPSI